MTGFDFDCVPPGDAPGIELVSVAVLIPKLDFEELQRIGRRANVPVSNIISLWVASELQQRRLMKDANEL